MLTVKEVNGKYIGTNQPDNRAVIAWIDSSSRQTAKVASGNYMGSYQIIHYNHLKNVDKRFTTPVSAYFYSTGSRIYCTVTAYNAANPDQFVTNTGFTGGSGYHKASAAFALACQTAGVEFKDNVSGVGNHAIKDAMFAIVKSMGLNPDSCHLVNTAN